MSLHQIFQVPAGWEDDSPSANRLNRALAEGRADSLIRQATATARGCDALEDLLQLVTFDRCPRSIVVTDFLSALKDHRRFDLHLMLDLDEVTSTAMLAVLDALRWRQMDLDQMTDKAADRIDTAVVAHQGLMKR